MRKLATISFLALLVCFKSYSCGLYDLQPQENSSAIKRTESGALPHFPSQRGGSSYGAAVIANQNNSSRTEDASHPVAANKSDELLAKISTIKGFVFGAATTLLVVGLASHR